jgi:hypothetical protein
MDARAEMQSCLDRLQSFIDEIQALMDHVDRGDIRSRAGKERAREMLRTLKSRLGAEHKRMDTVKGQAALNEIERTCYAPQVQEAYCHLAVSVSSNPGPKWGSDLYEAQLDLEHIACELRSELEATEEA